MPSNTLKRLRKVLSSNEKMAAVSNIQAYFYALKSSSSSEEVSFRR